MPIYLNDKKINVEEINSKIVLIWKNPKPNFSYLFDNLENITLQHLI